ncbi:hypothetical protein M422DRAFT_51172 [Sphaerobolus stellatus SS14]|uniref:No apical meristem-associated C-terminal domain-containing protein n=1 Tax=Sphaerobolus stellatus (strain SS14) TaxID=990650 RepID=A0A0C9V3F9_SPHS4|nr:hypothetical protein M422DRAFT_57172 [Sphaerobolus stellatus SS14]KIJ36277.1 hypothetical protein M422DRAFT_51172 [Sphaerobolus stellatus SS14]
MDAGNMEGEVATVAAQMTMHWNVWSAIEYAVESDFEDDATAAAKQSKENKKKAMPAKKAEAAKKAEQKNTRRPGKAAAAQEVDKMRVEFEAARAAAECRARDQEVKESEARIGLLEQEKVVTFLRAFEES